MKGRKGKEKNNNTPKPEYTGRIKELAAINIITRIVREGKSIDETLQQICMNLPKVYQYQEKISIKITYKGQEYQTHNFIPSVRNQQQNFETSDKEKGLVEVHLAKNTVDEKNDVFLKEEHYIIENTAKLICKFLNKRIKKIKIDNNHTNDRLSFQKKYRPPASLASRSLLQKFLNKSNVNRDIYHDLMPFKVREILLIANLYDAYSIEKEGKFSEHVLGEYYQLNLTQVPRIIGVSSAEEAFEMLNTKHFDLIIYMVGVDKNTPLTLSQKIKQSFPYIPIFLLLNNNTDIAFYEKTPLCANYIDRLFVWNGDSRIFFSMIKLVEDSINVENDTRVGLVRVVLLVEDSPIYYSRYLPLLYQIVMEQTKRIIEDVSTDELYKILRMRARPKILLASTYNDALKVLQKYKDNILCLITDVKYEKDGIENVNAGFELTKYVRDTFKNLPVIVQSSEFANKAKAEELQASFIDKNSESLLQELQHFITIHLGFGNFIYRDKNGKQIGVARTLKEFEKKILSIPDESLIYHAKRDHFSLWLMARGEIQAARILNPRKVADFESTDALRKILIEVIQKFRNEQNKGKIIPFDENAILDDANILSLSEGSLGGKGRGLAFLNSLIQNYNFAKHVPDINIRTPKTSIIGTDEFEDFMERNKLRETVIREQKYDKIKQKFLKGKLSEALSSKLGLIISKITRPIAVRSSGLFEDSLMQPFAGIFETYLLPNSHPDFAVRLQQATNAIKLVYASIYSPVARGYFEASNYKLEEEKMAVVLQEVVGTQHKNYFYPHLSGVAQSYNFYPFGHMKPEEGFSIAAIGLGKYVVEGEKAYRFSPKYPSIEINTPKEQYKNSQLKFFAVDVNKQQVNLMEGDTAGLAYLDIDVAENHGTLKHCASVYDADNRMIYPGINRQGPRIINFANILKHDYIPLAKTIETLLNVVKEALGSPVELEFAVDLNKDGQGKASFYLLQIKPIIGNARDYEIDMHTIDKAKILLYAEKGMGNGLIDHIEDVIYIDPVYFDKRMTAEMAKEIEALNKKMCSVQRQYVLIGPGRWGTRDPWIGIPVKWPQISNAKIIVETSLEDFPLDASSGSHFFHNVTAMNVGYFSIQQEMSGNYINWEILQQQQLVEKTKYLKHIRFAKPLEIRMDGKKQISVITFAD